MYTIARGTIQMLLKDLLDVCRTLNSGKLTIGTWGNFSIRSGDTSFIITPSGMDYDTLCENDFVLVDLEGTVIEGIRVPSIETKLHSAVYKARKDVHAIAHTHSDYAKSFSIARKPIGPFSEDMVQIVGGQVNVSEYCLPGTEELGKAAAAALGDHNAVLLANHGLVAVGRDIKEAVKTAEVVERNAKSILLSYLTGGPVELSRDDVDAMREFYLNKYGQK